MPYLPVDTAVTITVGPLIDDSDFKSQETAIAYDAAGMSVDLIKNSGIATAKVDLTLTTGGASDWTHIGSAYYEIEVTAAQNDTEGTLRGGGVCNGVLPFESPVYTVISAARYAELVTGAGNIGDAALVAIELDHFMSAACGSNDIGNNVVDQSALAVILTADGDISAYDDNTDSQEAIKNALGLISTAALADAFLDEALSGHTTGGTVGAMIGVTIPANITTAITHATDIKGTGFAKDTNSLVNMTLEGSDSRDATEIYDAVVSTISSTPAGWYTLNYPVTDSNSNAIVGAHCFVFTDAALTNAVWHGKTDSTGYTLLACSATTGYIVTSHPSHSFPNPDTETVFA